MPLPLLAFALLVGLRADTPIALTRNYVKGEKLAYQVLSHLTAESRGKGIDTWIPSDIDLNYNFTWEVQEMRPDGIAVVHYLRPTVTEIKGETFTSPPQSKVEKLNFDLLLTMSPINEILEQKDLYKKPTIKKPRPARLMVGSAKAQTGIGLFDQFIGEVVRLSLFVGGLDSAMDFAPRLPLEEVKIGDSWKRTVGYQPQKLKGKDGKTAVQRLDYTYTYMGPMDSNGKKVLRIQAKLNFTTDLMNFVKQLLGDRADETNLEKFPLKLNATIDYDLDPKTRHTLYAEARSEGGYQLFTKDDAETAAREERFKGRTSMELVSRKIVTPTKK